MQQLEQGHLSGIEALDVLLSEEYSTRETRRIDVVTRPLDPGHLDGESVPVSFL